MVSSKQREDVDRRVEYTAISNCHQVTYKGRVLNIHAAIHLAFVLGIRAGMSKPDVVGDYMSRWIHDRTLGATPEEMGADTRKPYTLFCSLYSGQQTNGTN